MTGVILEEDWYQRFGADRNTALDLSNLRISVNTFGLPLNQDYLSKLFLIQCVDCC